MGSPASLLAEPRTHRGLHVRAGAGAVYVDQSTETEPVTTLPMGFDPREVGLSGGGLSLLLSVGGTPVDGLIVGGGYELHRIFSPRVEVGETPSDSDEAANVHLFGVLADWYPWSGWGFHLGGKIGLALMSSRGPEAEDGRARGPGAAAWFGYSPWVADDWMIGGQLRLLAAMATNRMDVEQVEVEFDSHAMAAALLVTVAYQ